MISVIICSVNPVLASQIERNINETIGIPWHPVIIDNRTIKRSISQIYNRGAEEAKYDILCFVHEDVLFKTADWGKIVHKYLAAHDHPGLIGIAGSKYKSRTPSGWSTGISALDCVNILHVSPEGKELKLNSNPDESTKIQDVLTIDGVFMCTRKEIWAKFRFNEEVLDGFHLYDIDFSFAVSRKYRVIVSFEIDLVHLTKGGDFGNQWLKYTLLWHRSNAASLPAKTGTVMMPEKRVERIICRNWLHMLRDKNISIDNKWKWINAMRIYDLNVWPYIVAFFSYRYLKPVFQLYSKISNYFRRKG